MAEQNNKIIRTINKRTRRMVPQVAGSDRTEIRAAVGVENGDYDNGRITQRGVQEYRVH